MDIKGILKSPESRMLEFKRKLHQNTALKRLQWLPKNGLIKKEGSGTKVKYGV